MLARKAEGDAKAMRRLATDPPPGADWLDDLTIYAVPLRYTDPLDAEPLERDPVVALVAEVSEWAAAHLRSTH